MVGTLGGVAGTLYVLAPSAEVWNDRAPQILRSIDLKVRQINRDMADSVGVEVTRVPAVAAGAGEADGAPVADAQGDDAVSKLVEGGQRLMTDFAISAPGFVLGGVTGHSWPSSCCATARCWRAA